MTWRGGRVILSAPRHRPRSEVAPLHNKLCLHCLHVLAYGGIQVFDSEIHTLPAATYLVSGGEFRQWQCMQRDSARAGLLGIDTWREAQLSAATSVLDL